MAVACRGHQDARADVVQRQRQNRRQEAAEASRKEGTRQLRPIKSPEARGRRRCGRHLRVATALRRGYRPFLGPGPQGLVYHPLNDRVGHIVHERLWHGEAHTGGKPLLPHLPQRVQRTRGGSRLNAHLHGFHRHTQPSGHHLGEDRRGHSVPHVVLGATSCRILAFPTGRPQRALRKIVARYVCGLVGNIEEELHRQPAVDVSQRPLASVLVPKLSQTTTKQTEWTFSGAALIMLALLRWCRHVCAQQLYSALERVEWMQQRLGHRRRHGGGQGCYFRIPIDRVSGGVATAVVCVSCIGEPVLCTMLSNSHRWCSRRGASPICLNAAT
ncbi:mitochondrial carrier protein-like protein [Leishmania tarentolae]|uniref:Mitochondrial carrier protein-like protein n=1 Tax=Leishmania tarentolae TaxID=5689 RepID=A0A640KGH3_LEITA|nr:mitochondrial carrier protein-like protein [Leishmania tarentolae]